MIVRSLLTTVAIAACVSGMAAFVATQAPRSKRSGGGNDRLPTALRKRRPESLRAFWYSVRPEPCRLAQGARRLAVGKIISWSMIRTRRAALAPSGNRFSEKIMLSQSLLPHGERNRPPISARAEPPVHAAGNRRGIGSEPFDQVYDFRPLRGRKPDERFQQPQTLDRFAGRISELFAQLRNRYAIFHVAPSSGNSSGLAKLKVCQGTTPPARQTGAHHGRFNRQNLYLLLQFGGICTGLATVPSDMRQPPAGCSTCRLGTISDIFQPVATRWPPRAELLRGKSRRTHKGTQIPLASSDSGITDPAQEIIMRPKLAIALVITSFLGATAIASAQTDPAQPAPGATSEGKVGTGASKMKPGKMQTSKVKSGTTTGMSSGSSRRGAPNPSGNAAPGMDNDSAK